MAAQRIDHLRSVADAGLCTWGCVVAVGTTIGLILNELGRNVVLPAPPLLARVGPGPRPGVMLPLAVGAALIAAMPNSVERLRWRTLLASVPLAATGWTLALALAEGTSGLTRGPTSRTDYLADVPRVRADPAGFLRHFTADIHRYEIHVRGHPPGMVLLLTGLDHLGLGGASWEAAIVIVLAATAPVAVMLVLRDVAGEQASRRACPWLVLTPAAIWIATSADALYMAVGAWAIAFVVLGSGRRGPLGIVMAAGGGILGGLVLLGSYGLILLATVPVAVLWSHRRDRPGTFRAVAISVTAATAVLVAMMPLGYSWIDGLRATRHEYQVLDIDRPYWAFLFINLSAWSLALGPATFMGLARLRDRRLWLVVGGGIAAAALANLSGLSSGEVERIWLPFTLWVLPAGAALSTDRRLMRMGLALQALSAIVLISIVTTEW
ncbi:MAG: hypothetical protein ABI658_13340 [Acidimicrobiales bacterium]